jgi:hypothetical protein
MPRSRLRFAASINEASFHAARCCEHRGDRGLHSGAKSCGRAARYTVDDASEELIILSVKHPAQWREHEDA